LTSGQSVIGKIHLDLVLVQSLPEGLDHFFFVFDQQNFHELAPKLFVKLSDFGGMRFPGPGKW
jgi:hypothetical protein